MNRAYVFAAGIVTAGLAASLFAGNPNPPAGPIGPTMVTLDQLGGMLEYQQRLLALGLREWESAVVTQAPGAGRVFTGSGVVNLVHAIAPAGNGVVKLYDAIDGSDKTTPIGSVYVGSCCNAPFNASLQLGVRVTKGLWVDLPQYTEATVTFRKDEAR